MAKNVKVSSKARGGKTKLSIKTVKHGAGGVISTTGAISVSELGNRIKASNVAKTGSLQMRPANRVTARELPVNRRILNHLVDDDTPDRVARYDVVHPADVGGRINVETRGARTGGDQGQFLNVHGFTFGDDVFEAVIESASEEDDDERARLRLLYEAAKEAKETTGTLEGLSSPFDTKVFLTAIDILGGSKALGRIRSEYDLLESIQRGFPIGVVDNLRSAGFSQQILEEVIAPKRTLARRKTEGQRLTVVESDASWRLAHVLALGEKVLSGRDQALGWLSRAKASLAGYRPFEVLSTALGAARVEGLLQQLEWGNT
jgi:putative toxin-antitoxin system antitoxin component (TIGR02293 family)